MSDTVRRMRRKGVLVAAALAFSAVLVPLRAAAGPGTGVCDSSAREVFGVPATRITNRMKAPKKVHDVKPGFPSIPPGTKGSGAWVGDALIAPDGRVRRVIVLRDLQFTPPFPEFGDSISAAVRQWRHAPTAVDGKDVPLCMTVSVNIHWR